MVKNGTPASPATARANKVLPVPGGPNNKTPLGILAPIALNLPGLRKNSTTSSNSCLASSAPATSLKVTLTLPSPCILARDLPKFMTRPDPPCVDCIIKNQNPIINTIGNADVNKLTHQAGCSGGCAVTSTPPSDNFAKIPASLGA